MELEEGEQYCPKHPWFKHHFLVKCSQCGAIDSPTPTGRFTVEKEHHLWLVKCGRVVIEMYDLKIEADELCAKLNTLHAVPAELVELCKNINHPVVILGGLDSILGAVVGGIIMGLIQQFAAGYLDGNFGLNGTGDVMPYVILLIILWFKPHGLFGIHEIERV